MKIVVRYVKRRKDDREVFRQQVLTFPATVKGGSVWQQALVRAVEHKRDGERIVSISEAGYH